MSQDKRIYKTLRIRYNDELKLFPSWKIESLDDLKEKVIARFDLHLNKDEFDLEYVQESPQGKIVKCLENIGEKNQIDYQKLDNFMKNKVEFVVIKRFSQKVQKEEKMMRMQRQQVSAQKLEQVFKLEQQECIQPCEVKHYTQCDKCLLFPIKNIRYKCIICDDFDLCQKCYLNYQQSQRLNDKYHPFIKIRKPVSFIKDINVAFEQKEFDHRMSKNCKEGESNIYLREEKLKNEIDASTLPQKNVTCRNFVQELFDENCAKRIPKVNQDFRGNCNSSLSLLDCS